MNVEMLPLNFPHQIDKKKNSRLQNIDSNLKICEEMKLSSVIMLNKNCTRFNW